MSKPTNLLIVEEALRNREGHWFEYNRATKAALQEVGDVDVSMLGNITMEPSVAEELGATPHFRFTVWDQIYNQPQAWKRYLGIARHNRRLYQDLAKHLVVSDHYDTVFAPTVVLHHFLGYHKIAKRFGGRKFRQLVLLVRNNIALYDNQGNRTFRGTAKFWRWAIKRFQPMLDSGAVRFVTDSERLADEYEELTGIRFQVLPHPCLIGLQAPSTPADESFGKTEKNSTSESTKSVRVFLPGPARYEKGADRLVEAAKLLSQQQDLSPIEMVFQWSDAFTLPNGSMLGPDDLPALNLSNVTFDVITKPLSSEAYHQQLLKADLIILPYRREVYFARISGVAVEAMMLGKPLLYTSDTWVDTIASQFDCGLSMDNDVAGVVEAISEAIANLDTMAQQSRGAAGDVASFFSAKSFTSKLLNS